MPNSITFDNYFCFFTLKLNVSVITHYFGLKVYHFPVILCT